MLVCEEQLVHLRAHPLLAREVCRRCSNGPQKGPQALHSLGGLWADLLAYFQTPAQPQMASQCLHLRSGRRVRALW